jgi:hypothetical protein
MGLFSQRPEEPTEWAGLPSEPARAESAAERLSDVAAGDLGGLDIAGLAIGTTGTSTSHIAIESIVIPVEPGIEIAGSESSNRDGPSVR